MPNPKVLISYSQKDEIEKKALLSHLGVLEHQGLIDVWGIEGISAGKNTIEELSRNVAQAQVAVLLITAHYLSDDSILNEEIPRILKNHERDGLIIYPIIARACAWKKVKWLADLEVRPRDGKALWPNNSINVDKYLAKIAEEIASLAAEPDLEILRGGDKVGRYIIRKAIGWGGWGIVYLAFDPQLNRDVALKVIKPEDESYIEKWKQRFRREVEAAARFNHPHIVQIHDADLNAKKPYVVMELLAGGTLKERIRTSPFSWPKAFKVLRNLAEALAYSHDQGIIHRDVKPGNVMFSGENLNTLKLVDFGLARWGDAEDITDRGDVVGTISYMPPEQADAKKVDHRVDIFSFGIVLFESIVGYNPLVGKGPEQRGRLSILMELTSDTPIDISDLEGLAPTPVIELARKALAKDPNERYQDFRELIHDLDECLQLIDDHYEAGLRAYANGKPINFGEATEVLQKSIQALKELKASDEAQSLEVRYQLLHILYEEELIDELRNQGDNIRFENDNILVHYERVDEFYQKLINLDPQNVEWPQKWSKRLVEQVEDRYEFAKNAEIGETTDNEIALKHYQAILYIQQKIDLLNLAAPRSIEKKLGVDLQAKIQELQIKIEHDDDKLEEIRQLVEHDKFEEALTQLEDHFIRPNKYRLPEVAYLLWKALSREKPSHYASQWAGYDIAAVSESILETECDRIGLIRRILEPWSNFSERLNEEDNHLASSRADINDIVAKLEELKKSHGEDDPSSYEVLERKLAKLEQEIDKWGRDLETIKGSISIDIIQGWLQQITEVDKRIEAWMDIRQGRGENIIELVKWSKSKIEEIENAPIYHSIRSLPSNRLVIRQSLDQTRLEIYVKLYNHVISLKEEIQPSLTDASDSSLELQQTDAPISFQEDEIQALPSLVDDLNASLILKPELYQFINPLKENVIQELLAEHEPDRLVDFIVAIGGCRFILTGYGRFGGTTLTQEIVKAVERQMKQQKTAHQLLVARFDFDEQTEHTTTFRATLQDKLIKNIVIDLESDQDIVIPDEIAQMLDILNDLQKGQLGKSGLAEQVKAIGNTRTSPSHMIIVIDKINQPNLLETVVNHPFFEHKTVTVLIVIAREAYNRWSEQVHRHLEKRKKFQVWAIPSLWEPEYKQVRKTVDLCFKGHHLDDKVAQELKHDFVQHISFVGRGSLGDILDELQLLKYWQLDKKTKQFYINFKALDQELIRNNALIQDILDRQWGQILKQSFPGRERADQAKQGIYALIDWIIDHGTFNLEEILEAATQTPVVICPHARFRNEVVMRLLNVFVANKFLKRVENKFDIIWGRDISQQNVETTTILNRTERIESWTEQLLKHQSNLRMLKEQKAEYGAGECPLHLLNQIKEEKKREKKAKKQLARLKGTGDKRQDSNE